MSRISVVTVARQDCDQLWFTEAGHDVPLRASLCHFDPDVGQIGATRIRRPLEVEEGNSLCGRLNVHPAQGPDAEPVRPHTRGMLRA